MSERRRVRAEEAAAVARQADRARIEEALAPYERAIAPISVGYPRPVVEYPRPMIDLRDAAFTPAPQPTGVRLRRHRPLVYSSTPG